MVLLGVDPDKDTHTVVAVDQAGRQLGQTTVAARTLGHAELLGWARHRWPEERVWAVEDCRHVTGRLERDLLAAGERVVRVPPRLMAGARHAVRVLGRSDRSTRWRSPGRRCANPTCRPLATTRRPGRSSCWSTTASSSSPSGPERSTGCAGACTGSTPTWTTPPDACPAHPGTHRRLARPPTARGPSFRRGPAAGSWRPAAEV